MWSVTSVTKVTTKVLCDDKRDPKGRKKFMLTKDKIVVSLSHTNGTTMTVDKYWHRGAVAWAVDRPTYGRQTALSTNDIRSTLSRLLRSKDMADAVLLSVDNCL